MNKGCVFLLNISFLFPGQGSQYEKMGTELSALSKNVTALYEEASEILSIDVAKTLATSALDTLSKTSHSQPLIYTVSCAALLVAKENGITAIATAGHSLGEYAALHHAGLFSFSDGLSILKERAKFMETCSKENPGAMCALMTDDKAVLADICNTAPHYLTPVNYNSPVQTVLAGHVDAVSFAMEKASSLGIRATKLNVGGAFHSAYMQQAADDLFVSLQKMTLKNEITDTAFYSNLTGTRIKEFILPDISVNSLTSYLSRHIVSPVRFTDEMQAMHTDGIDTFIELGPKRTLSSFVKRTLPEAIISNIEDKKSFTKTMALFS